MTWTDACLCALAAIVWTKAAEGIIKNGIKKGLLAYRETVKEERRGKARSVTLGEGTITIANGVTYRVPAGAVWRRGHGA